MTRLAKKRLLRAEKRDQAYIYYPNFTQEEFISRFVEHMLENLLISFSGATRDGLEALSDPQAAAQAQRLLDNIARRRAAEETEVDRRLSNHAIGEAHSLLAIWRLCRQLGRAGPSTAVFLCLMYQRSSYPSRWEKAHEMDHLYRIRRMLPKTGQPVVGTVPLPLAIQRMPREILSDS